LISAVSGAWSDRRAQGLSGSCMGQWLAALRTYKHERQVSHLANRPRFCGKWVTLVLLASVTDWVAAKL
jgi:hypothetical protein